MTSKQTLVTIFKTNIEICDKHASFLQEAIENTQSFIPLNAETLQNLSFTQNAALEVLSSRFPKLLDCMGSKIFPLVLQFSDEDTEAMSFMDILNRLEKLGYIPSRIEWQKLREFRNHIAHEYPEQLELVVENINAAPNYIQQLCKIWDEVKLKSSKLLA